MKINKLYILIALVCLSLFSFSQETNAQTKGTQIKVIVVDEQENPLSAVSIYVSNGTKATTNTKGQFTVTLLDDEAVAIEKKGFESKLLNFSELTTGTNITLKKLPFLATEDDEIKMGVANKDLRSMVGAVSSINTEERLTYDNTQFVRSYINGLILGVRGSDNIRGIGNAIFVIDGVIGRDPNILNTEEVEQITVLKDANAVALYGSQARNGVIIINTKRGQVNKKLVKVNVISGIRQSISLPNYLNAADYKQLFNEALANDNSNRRPFSQEEINNTRSGENPFEFPDVDYFSDEFVKPFVSTFNVVSEFSGGNDKSQYYVNVGWNRIESWENTNPDANRGVNRFNVRGNLDFRINDWITSSLDGIAILQTNRTALSQVLNAGNVIRPNEYAPLLPISLIDINARPNSGLVELLSGAETFDGNLLGGNVQFQNNTPIAEALAGGFQNNISRLTQFNNSINFDLSAITEGLSARTYFSFDFFDSNREFNDNDYRVYEPVWENNRIVELTAFNIDRSDQRRQVATNRFISRLGFYGLLNYEKTFAKNHSINSTLLAFYNSQQTNGVIQTDRDSHIGFQTTYDYKKKLFVDFSGAYINSIKLPEGNRGGLSPTFGLAYILSEEDFLKNNKFINYLKIRATGGIIKSDLGIEIDGEEYFLYEENYSEAGNFSWNDGERSNQRQGISQQANPDMTFEERIDLNLGFESLLLNSLFVEFNYFRTELDKQVGFLGAEYPSFYNTFRPIDNFNSDLFTGFELGINYNKTIKDLSIALGANLLFSQTEASKRSEIREFAYQNRVGRELSTFFGLEDEGFYTKSDFRQDASGNLLENDKNQFILVNNLVVTDAQNIQPGDIKYKDQNGDNVIDEDDEVALGQTRAPWSYAMNMNLNYKGFNLFVLATAESGAIANRSNNYFRVDGNDKYSEVVLGRWTPETANTATFPRLSSVNNENNFRNSTFWIYDNSFFNINRAQLTYELKDQVCDNLGVNALSFNLQGTNLLQISKNRDIRQLNIGGAPQFRAYTLGARVSF